ncbi:FecR family protein [Sphingobacterium hungaricum]|uniref:Anti-sigma factor n=1 Tax=Sphingobacterium hungaricum TaxID=2082723 RepID=A0A928UV73_9SPHI|nr:FecR domain-containing protein [Sphingobacterium hungaricum]MBE8712473.1 anti-sigma factor [Sphingobacterium hungaricum]
MTRDKVNLLLKKYANGTCTPEESQLLEIWLTTISKEEKKILFDEHRIALWNSIEQRIVKEDRKIAKIQTLKKWIPAVAALFLISFGILFWRAQNQHTSFSAIKQSDEIVPGSNKALLTLSDGRKIELNDNASQVLNDEGIIITKTANGQLKYEIKANKSLKGGFNTISTPRGGQYEILLPDGSMVSLNALSSLTFPVDINEQKSRSVRLTGEGFFDVAKDKSRPFIVKSDNQEIRVLGTKFNVNSYHSNAIQTTLIEGSVLINNDKKLIPGQQSTVSGNSIAVKEVDVEDFIDWKNNSFVFRDESLESILERVSRWYDVDILYVNNSAKQVQFNGEISRYANVGEVLSLLEKTSNIKFAIINRIIQVR